MGTAVRVRRGGIQAVACALAWSNPGTDRAIEEAVYAYWRATVSGAHPAAV